MIRKQREAKELEEKLENERKDLLKKHASELKKQMVEKSEKNEQQKKVKETENQDMESNFMAQRHLLEKVKKEKINELKNLNVPEKYIVELENKKIY